MKQFATTIAIGFLITANVGLWHVVAHLRVIARQQTIQTCWMMAAEGVACDEVRDAVRERQAI